MNPKNFDDFLEGFLNVKPTYYYKTWVEKPSQPISEDDYEINTTKDGRYFHIDVPGYNKDNIDVSVEDTYLVLSGSRTYKTDSGEIKKVLDKRINLKTYTNPNLIEASVVDGVLTVFVPEPVSSGNKRNKINVI